MIARVRLFAAAKQLAGVDCVEFDLTGGATVADLREEMVRSYPELGDIVRHAAFAVDEAYASDATKLSEQSDIACIPPVSGG